MQNHRDRIQYRPRPAKPRPESHMLGCAPNSSADVFAVLAYAHKSPSTTLQLKLVLKYHFRWCRCI